VFILVGLVKRRDFTFSFTFTLRVAFSSAVVLAPVVIRLGRRTSCLR
jgi:hypothetical protein